MSPTDIDLKNSCIHPLQFDKDLLSVLFRSADKIKTLDASIDGRKKLQLLLPHIRAALYFNQPSTRTYISFTNACHILGIKISDIRDSGNSSEQKGESVHDTIHTLSQYTDLIIMRHKDDNAANEAASFLSENGVKLINAGSGKDQHPTQALLDIYTIYDHFKNKVKTDKVREVHELIDGKTILIAGDIKRGRAARSLINLLSKFKVSLILASPDELKADSDINEVIKKNKELTAIHVNEIGSNFNDADIIYMTRIQDEYDSKNESSAINYEPFKLKYSHLKNIKKDAIIMHPLPRRDEIEITIDSDKRAVYWQQEKNGLWVRAALIAYMFGLNKELELL